MRKEKIYVLGSDKETAVWGRKVHIGTLMPFTAKQAKEDLKRCSIDTVIYKLVPVRRKDD